MLFNPAIDSPDKEETEIVSLATRGKQSTRLDPYDVVVGDPIGEGSCGVVYRGLYKNQYNVAIKMVKRRILLLRCMVIDRFDNFDSFL